MKLNEELLGARVPGEASNLPLQPTFSCLVQTTGTVVGATADRLCLMFDVKHLALLRVAKGMTWIINSLKTFKCAMAEPLITSLLCLLGEVCMLTRLSLLVSQSQGDPNLFLESSRPIERAQLSRKRLGLTLLRIPLPPPHTLYTGMHTRTDTPTISK